VATLIDPPPTKAGDADALIREARRRARRRRLGFAMAVVLAGAGLLFVLGGGTGGGGPVGQRRAGRPFASKTFVALAPWRSRPRVLLRDLDHPQAYAAGGSLYISDQTRGRSVGDELLAVDPASGQVRAVRDLDSTFDQALLARGVLWVTSSLWQMENWGYGILWRLDPLSLRVISRTRVPDPGSLESGLPSLAVAGGWLWVGGADRISRVSLETGRITKQVAVPDAGAVDVAADPSGRVLLDAEGYQASHIQRRSPQTGALERSSGAIQSVATPRIGGIADGAAWIVDGTGMAAAIERLSVKTLRPTAFAGAEPGPGISPTTIVGTNGIRVQLINRVLWVSDFGAVEQLNYCGVGSTARALAPLPANTSFLTADTGHIYVELDADSPNDVELATAAIHPRCY
jgi:hypothetical protein